MTGMLLNCIRQKAVSWRLSGDVLSLPFGEEACERCKQLREEVRQQQPYCRQQTGQWLELIARDPVVPTSSPPPPPPSSSVPDPFPSSPTAVVSTSPANKQPPISSSLPPLVSPIYSEPSMFGSEIAGSPRWRHCQEGMLNGDAAENLQPPRPARNKGTRANQLLQQLRDGEEGTESDTTGQRGGFVFLEYQGETKRSALPPNVRSVEQIKSLFLRSFAALSPTEINSTGIKIYIQSTHSPHHRLFYELEDICEVKDQSVLRLFEQSSQSLAASSPSSPLNHQPHPPTRPPRSVVPPAMDYFSEPEMEWTGTNGASGNRELAALRPASVQPQLLGRQRRKAGTNGNGWHEPSDWHSAYSSDSSSGLYARSGSNTPVIPGREETQRKVDSLERQLASLSELVHSALMPNRELMGTDWKELSKLRSEILEERSPMTESATSTISNHSMTAREMAALTSKELISQLDALREDLGTLRRETVRSAQQGRDMVERAVERVRRMAPSGWDNAERDEMEQRRDDCLERLDRLQNALREFEAALENTRSSVLNSTRRLRMDEVDELTGRLGEIGREAVELKMGIPALQHDLEESMRRTMARLSEEERILHDKLPLVDGCLRRCKTLANMMVTMKKLAMVQDERSGNRAQAQRRAIPVRHITLRNLPQTTAHQHPPVGHSAGHHPLDAILDELNGNAISPVKKLNNSNNEISASFTLCLPVQSRTNIPEGTIH